MFTTRVPQLLVTFLFRFLHFRSSCPPFLHSTCSLFTLFTCINYPGEMWKHSTSLWWAGRAHHMQLITAYFLSILSEQPNRFHTATPKERLWRRPHEFTNTLKLLIIRSSRAPSVNICRDFFFNETANIQRPPLLGKLKKDTALKKERMNYFAQSHTVRPFLHGWTMFVFF